MVKKFVYICSPFKGKDNYFSKEKNIKDAKEFSQWTYSKGKLPLCVHIYLEEATGLDEKKQDRKELLKMGKEFIRICDEVWVFGEVSEGMEGEIEYAKRLKKEIKWI